VAQLAQELFVQIWPPALQSVAVTRQFPVVQPPDRQSCPVAHWSSVVQLTQLWVPSQICPLLQVLLVWQFPLTQAVPTQMWPVP
jgi:hypothetical protein